MKLKTMAANRMSGNAKAISKCAVNVVSLLMMGLLFSCHQTPLPAYGAVSGESSEINPQTGEVVTGDLLRPDGYIKNLTVQEGRTIPLRALYTPKQYQLLFDANGGIFPDGTMQKEVRVTYNDGTPIYAQNSESTLHQMENSAFIQLPEQPQAENHRFAGWYLKGNQRPKINASALDGTLISDGSRYMIANDDASDLAAAEHTADGTTIARALWRSSHSEVEDGNEADGKAPGTGGPSGPDGGSSDAGKDLWDPLHPNNYVVEMTPDADNKAAYERKHGKIHEQYRRIYFNAETSLASAYHWFHKPAGTDTFIPLEETGCVYLADRLTRTNQGDTYRCEVEIGEDGDRLRYETSITVYYLPEIKGTRLQVNGIPV